jgi:hypothetical protein
MRSFSTSTRRFLVAFALGSSLTALAGCGDSSVPAGPTGTVAGKVTCNGKPVPAGCTVMFVHQEKSLPASGLTAADGSYTLLARGQPKVSAGAHKISVSPPVQDAAAGVSSADPEAYKAVMTGKKAAPAEQKGPFPKKYLSADTSGLTFTVKEGSNTCDLDLNEGT